MLVLLLFAFFSGLLTIAAPCIWPLLPVVLSTSSLKGRRRPLGVTLGVLLSFGVTTLSVSYLVHWLGFDASLLRTLAVVMLVALGTAMLLPAVGAGLEARLSRWTGRVRGGRAGTGLWPGFVSGLPLGIVWAPCAGPILATIATLAATRQVGVSIVLVTVVYLAGIGIPLLAFAYGGQALVARTRLLGPYTGALQRLFGAVVIVTALVIAFDQDTKLEADLLARVPAYSDFLTRLEGNSTVTTQLNKLRGIDYTPATPPVAQMFNENAPAPDFAGISTWLNLPSSEESLSIDKLRGKVVLIDFWTYTCINCIRTLPHLNAWAETYRDDGLVVVGVHTPEFAFERDTGNVRQAVQRFGIRYPVPQDNEYATWKDYRNQYWPGEYLIDRAGNIRRIEYGEGEYDKTEAAIRELLKQDGAEVRGNQTKLSDPTPTQLSSPESYLGSESMVNYFPTARLSEGPHTGLQPNPAKSLNSFDFAGDWDVMPEYSQAIANAVLEYRFHGEHVYLVMRPGPEGGTMRVFLDGPPVDAANAGADVEDGAVSVTTDRLYELLDLRGRSEEHILRLEVSPGLQLFVFTFG